MSHCENNVAAHCENNVTAHCESVKCYKLVDGNINVIGLMGNGLIAVGEKGVFMITSDGVMKKRLNVTDELYEKFGHLDNCEYAVCGKHLLVSDDGGMIDVCFVDDECERYIINIVPLAWSNDVKEAFGVKENVPDEPEKMCLSVPWGGKMTVDCRTFEENLVENHCDKRRLELRLNKEKLCFTVDEGRVLSALFMIKGNRADVVVLTKKICYMKIVEGELKHISWIKSIDYVKYDNFYTDPSAEESTFIKNEMFCVDLPTKQYGEKQGSILIIPN